MALLCHLTIYLKISYFMIPSKTVQQGGENNVIKTAVREALLANGNADVLVGLNTQIKYDAKGQPESITVTGYPAKYVNFRSPSDEEILKLKAYVILVISVVSDK